jgi:hypothetical protein
MKLEHQAIQLGWTCFPYIVSGVVFWRLIEHVQPNTVLDHGLELTVAGTILIFWLIFAYIGCLRLCSRLRDFDLNEEQHIQSLARVRGLIWSQPHEDLR